MSHNLLVGIYFHPEAYPPTLNAIGELAEMFDKVTVVHRPHAQTEWEFPPNVRTVAPGEMITSREQELAPLSKKISFFFQFVRAMLSVCRAEKPTVILVYDSISLLALRLVLPFIGKKPILWYHNHDVTEWQQLRKYSIGWFAGRAEAKTFEMLDIFSLPSNERQKYFPMDKLTGKYFFIPNYPARKFYNKFYHAKTAGSPIRLIFQGAIGPYHGIEEIIPFLNQEIDGYALQLVLKGPCLPEHRTLYEALARDHKVDDRLIFAGVTKYAQVPETAATCHIGIGILAKNDIMNTSLGTASNKLYEYAAVGLPVIYYDSPNFTRYLRQYEWALPTKLEPNAIRNAISLIINDFKSLSVKAHRDFDNSLNFESGFSEVKSYLRSLLANFKS